VLSWLCAVVRDLLLEDCAVLMRLMAPRNPDGLSWRDDDELAVDMDDRLLGASSFFLGLLSSSLRALRSPTSSRLWSVQMTSNMAPNCVLVAPRGV